MNSVLAQALESSNLDVIGSDDLSISAVISKGPEFFDRATRALNPRTARDRFCPSPQLAESLKFSICLPAGTVVEILRERLVNMTILRQTLQRPRRLMVADRCCGER